MSLDTVNVPSYRVVVCAKQVTNISPSNNYDRVSESDNNDGKNEKISQI